MTKQPKKQQQQQQQQRSGWAWSWSSGATAAAVGLLALGASRYWAGSSSKSASPLGSGEMFDGIAPMYDYANRIMSLGMDGEWRRVLVEELRLEGGMRLLDVATGTADVAILARRTERGLQVMGLDPSEEMLKIGRVKVSQESLGESVVLVKGDAQSMPEMETASFDRVSISFGIRNVPDRGAALREMSRVLKPGGVAAVMELHLPSEGWLAPVAEAFIHYVAPLVGTLTGAHQEYQHLRKSISQFPRPDEWRTIMADNGLPVQKTISMCWGVVQLYIASPAAS